MKSSSFGQDDTGQQGGVYMSGGHVDLYITAEQSERELIKSKSGRRIILQLLHPNQQKYVPLHLQHMAHPPPKPASGFEILEDQVNQ